MATVALVRRALVVVIFLASLGPDDLTSRVILG
jgi:hypothetical protein